MSAAIGMLPRDSIATIASHVPGYCDAMHAFSPRRSIDAWARKAAAHGAGEDQTGQGMVEYALILVLIAVVVVVILTLVGSEVNNAFSNVSSGLGS